MKTAALFMLGSSTALAQDVFSSDNTVITLRGPATDAYPAGEMHNVTYDVASPKTFTPAAGSGMKFSCAPLESYHSVASTDANGVPTLPDPAEFANTFVLSCSAETSGNATMYIEDPDRGRMGTTFKLALAGTCAGVVSYDYSGLVAHEIAHDGTDMDYGCEFEYTPVVNISNPCPGGAPTVAPTQVKVTMTIGEIDSRIPDSLKQDGSNVALEQVTEQTLNISYTNKYGSADSAGTFKFGMYYPALEYFSSSCSDTDPQLCVGAVKLEFQKDGAVLETKRYSGFTFSTDSGWKVPAVQVPTFAKTTKAKADIEVTPSTPGSTQVTPQAMLTFASAGNAANPVNLMEEADDICGDGLTRVYADVQVADDCYDVYAASYTALCAVDTAKNNNFTDVVVDVGSENITVSWDNRVFSQNVELPSLDVSKSVAPNQFGTPILVTLADGSGARVHVPNTGVGVVTKTVQSTYRPGCDLVSTTVDADVTFSVDDTQDKVGPVLVAEPKATFQKWEMRDDASAAGVTIATDGDALSAPGVKFCTTNEDRTTDCHDAYDTGRDFVYFTGVSCDGLKENDVVKLVAWDSQFLPSGAPCPSGYTAGADGSVEMGTLVLDYGITFHADGFDDQNQLQFSKTSSLDDHITEDKWVLSETDTVCQADGSMVKTGITSACDQFAELVDSNFTMIDNLLTTCGGYLTRQVIFTDNRTGVESFRFCNTKKLSITKVSQEGYLTATLSVTQATGTLASVGINSLAWESCEADGLTGLYKQVLVLDVSGTDETEVVTTSSNHLRTGSDIANGQTTFKSVCVDECTAPGQLDDAAAMAFTIDGVNFELSTQLLSNPCNVEQTQAGLPDMALTFSEKVGTNDCDTTDSKVTQFAQNTTACIHLDSTTQPALGAELTNVVFSAIQSDGTVASLGAVSENNLKGSNGTYDVSTSLDITAAMGGQSVAVHVTFEQVEATGRRRLRAVYILGAKEMGDADASFTVLPSHITVQDEASTDSESAAGTAVTDEAPNWATLVNMVVGILILVILSWGIMARVVKNNSGGMGYNYVVHGGAKPVRRDYTPVGRFTSQIEY